LRAAMADDLDAPRALAAVDHWASGAASGQDGDLIRQAVDALLGVRL
jgi:L-cysteine:1D-myo-inositol 2-amino-2-deoxy-alpha-D-glucopyranoside ligase